MDLTKYDLEIDTINKTIMKKKPKTVLLQLPDGLKPHAVDILKKINHAEVSIWAGTCFGACDIPNIKNSLLIQFGHNSFKKKL
jgi:diphthamide biosynthesis enzyme Dph1/Dph2-like protein